MGGLQACQRRNRGSAQDVSVSEEDATTPGRWEAEDFIEICGEGEEHYFHNKARLLPPSAASSVASAVQKLNDGHLTCPEGFCVVLSMTRGRYYLLWRKGMKNLALEKLGVDEASPSRRIAEPQREAPSPQRSSPARGQRSSDAERRGGRSGEFVIAVDRTGRQPLGIDVQPEEPTNSLFIEGVAAEGLVAQWNARTTGRPVRPGDRIVEVNGDRGDTGALITQCKLFRPLTMWILPGLEPHVATRRDASCNTTPMDCEVRVPVAEPETSPADGSLSGASRCGSSGSDGERRASGDQAPVPQTIGRVAPVPSSPPVALAPRGPVEEFEVELDRNDGSMLGVDVTPDDANASLLIEGVSEGLVSRWNDEHPEQLVKSGDRIKEVNGCSGDLSALIEQCKTHQLLKMKLQRG